MTVLSRRCCPSASEPVNLTSHSVHLNQSFCTNDQRGTHCVPTSAQMRCGRRRREEPRRRPPVRSRRVIPAARPVTAAGSACLRMPGSSTRRRPTCGEFAVEVLAGLEVKSLGSGCQPLGGVADNAPLSADSRPLRAPPPDSALRTPRCTMRFHIQSARETWLDDCAATDLRARCSCQLR